jgi:hypothetical protein
MQGVKGNYILGVALLILCLSAERKADAQLTILHSFGDGSVPGDGANPSAGLI